jgi:hypothetical protein
LAIALIPAAALSHPAPFTYLDLRLEPTSTDVTLVAHVFDVAHDLNVNEPSQLLDPGFLDTRRADVIALFKDRVSLGVAPATTAVEWTNIGFLAERQSLVLSGRAAPAAGELAIRARLFPYDPAHQTFVNVYEEGALTLQAILDYTKTELEYFPGSAQGTIAVLRRFATDGVRHGLTGLEHWLFLFGLLAVDGGRRLITRAMLAFAVADALTTTLIVLNIVHPAARLTDPALALTIVYIGADNLMVRGGRDVRPWIALAFGILHGFWFGGALALMDLPRGALVWSLWSFHLGSLLAQAAGIAVIVAALSVVRRATGAPPGRIAAASSLIVLAGGTYLFAQRVFFPGGIL